MRSALGFLALALGLLIASPVRAGVSYLDDLELDMEVQPWGRPHHNLSAARTPLTIAGTVFPAGLGVQANSEMWISLGRGTASFTTRVSGNSEKASKRSFRHTAFCL